MKRLPFAVFTALAFAIAAAAWLAQPSRAVEAQIASAGLPVAPDFTLTDSTGKTHHLADYRGKYVVLEWINHGCPFVKKFYNVGKMQALQKESIDKGVVWLTICSSAEGKQGYYTADEWNSIIEEKGMKSTAVLLDTDGVVGKAYHATNTPHMYIINPDGKLVYQGAIDDNPSADSADIESAHNYVEHVLGAALTSKTQAYGCGVKY